MNVFFLQFRELALIEIHRMLHNVQYWLPFIQSQHRICFRFVLYSDINVAEVYYENILTAVRNYIQTIIHDRYYEIEMRMQHVENFIECFLHLENIVIQAR